jgi:hypothetical protein
MEEDKRTEEPRIEAKNIIVVFKSFEGKMLFLYSPEKQWHLPRIHMRADNFLGEFNQLFIELGLLKEAIIENLQGIIELSTLPGNKFPFDGSDAVWLYLFPDSGPTLSGQYREYIWVHSLAELNSLQLANIYAEIFRRFEHFKLKAPKANKSLWHRFWRRGSRE